MIDEYFFDETFNSEIDLEEFPLDSNSSSVGIARVCINNATAELEHFYSYLIPDRLDFLKPGCRVRIPFGARVIDGIIFQIERKSRDEISKLDFKLREIYDSFDLEPWFSPENLKSIEWMSRFYLTPPAQIIRMFLPESRKSKISILYEKEYRLIREISAEELDHYRKRPAQLEAIKLFSEHKILTDDQRKSFKITPATIKKLESENLISIQTRRIFRNGLENFVKDPLPKLEFDLTEDQAQALSRIKSGAKKFLLHGVTGSGKTYVYMLVAEKIRRDKKSVIVLVPEISLTGQMVRSFQANFPDDVIVLHSKLSASEKSDAMIRIRRGEVGIIVGARSALFVPAQHIGLIIIDEEQDFSYKQDRNPRYSARVVAEEFARIHDAILILGSATPSLETYYRAIHGELELLKLPRRVGDRPLPKISAVDMRDEFKHGNRNVLSVAMQNLIQRTLNSNQQMIILLNRRGFSTFIMCRECGEVIKCSTCNLPLTYHAGNFPRLLCHHCDAHSSIPTICPHCGSSYIKFFGTGTERLEYELTKKFPMARVIRMDHDTTKGKFSHEEILQQFRDHEFDILLGTQMVSKGHDIPDVTAVGIVSADSILNFPDFRASEQCFALITQTAGRAGRGEISGEVVIQVYEPNAPAIQFSVDQDYEKFYEREIKSREELNYPPFSRLVKLIFSAKNQIEAKQNASIFVQKFSNEIQDEVIGPASAMIENFNGFYRFVVLIKTQNLDRVRDFLESNEIDRRRDISIDIDPISTS